MERERVGKGTIEGMSDRECEGGRGGIEIGRGRGNGERRE